MLTKERIDRLCDAAFMRDDGRPEAVDSRALAELRRTLLLGLAAAESGVTADGIKLALDWTDDEGQLSRNGRERLDAALVALDRLAAALREVKP